MRSNYTPGVRFGRLVIESRAPNYQVNCICDCGTKKTVKARSLSSGHTSSCGCLHRERLADRNHVHGMAGTRTYTCWQKMHARCADQTDMYYGGRGIRVDARWNAFANFLTDMGEVPLGLTLERKRVNENYSKSNCCWATRKEQSRNKRVTVYHTRAGQLRPLVEWAELFSINYGTVKTRIKLGWSVDASLTEPVQKTGRWHA